MNWNLVAVLLGYALAILAGWIIVKLYILPQIKEMIEDHKNSKIRWRD